MKLKVVKDVGKISVLENKINFWEHSYIGIDHTRWTTHGRVTINNSHPHKQGNITLVHNEIIDNYLDIKKKLLELDYKFKGETDSEVLCGLIDCYYNETEDILESLNMVMKEIKGSYACAIIVDDNYDKITCIYVNTSYFNLFFSFTKTFFSLIVFIKNIFYVKDA